MDAHVALAAAAARHQLVVGGEFADFDVEVHRLGIRRRDEGEGRVDRLSGDRDQLGRAGWDECY
jgi:hypothetical protein